jgi:mono/diheme cytochrome c family protein
MRALLLSCLLLATAPACAQPAARSRGELLYSTHCVECHTAQMHWRARRLARDWDTLRAQVWRWQREVRLGWAEEDVDAVTNYLNEAIYRFPRGQALAPVPSGQP